MKRCFLAVTIPEDLIEKIEKIKEEFLLTKARVSWVSKDNFHYTLRFFGNLDDERIEKISSIILEASQHFNKFDAEIKNIGCFPKEDFPRVIWIGMGEGADKLREIFNHLENEFVKLKLEKENRFEPHLTLGRVKPYGLNDELREKIKKYKDCFLGKFKIEKLTLFESKLSPKGAIYKIIKEFNLKD